MYRVTLDPVKIERYEPVPKAGSYTHDWMIADGGLYFMTGTGDSVWTKNRRDEFVPVYLKNN